MKLNFLTLYTPTAENIKGPSALPYYILLHRNSDIEVEIHSFNLNEISQEVISEIEKDLNCKIHIYPLPLWYQYLTKFKLTSLRVLFKYPLFSYIKPSKKMIKMLTKNEPDIIWRYPDYFFSLSDKLSKYKQVVTGPDCPALVYFRQLKDSSGYKNLIYWLGLSKVAYGAIQQAKTDTNNNVMYHLVGLNDWREQMKITPSKKVFFLLHPHFELKKSPSVSFKKDIIKILIPGKNDFYMQSGINELIPVICSMNEEIKKRFEFSFIGKGWEYITKTLNENGTKATHIKWVDNYIESISEYDIQLSPITVGGGTKGKVLDAIANGLLVIGTEVAMENIAVRHNDSCIVYKNAIQIPAILQSIMHNPDKYERIAIKGMNQARKYHSPQRISKRFFDIITKF